MYLNQIEIHDNKKLKKLNNYLRENFKIRVDINSTEEDLQSLRECTIDEIQDLKIVHGCTPKDADLSKSLAVVEAVDLILSSRKNVKESSERFGPYTRIVDMLSDAVAKYVKQGDDMDTAISIAMREYRSSTYRYPDFEIEQAVRSSVNAKLMGGDDSLVDENMAKGLGVEMDEGGDFYHPDTEYGSVKPSAKPRAKAKDVPTVYSPR